MRQETLILSGHRFNVLVAGEAGQPLMLFLHGFPEYSAAYEDLMPHLAEEFLCVAPDQRGFGASWKPQNVKDYVLPALLSDAAEVIAHYSSDRTAVVVGHDWGSAVAYGLAFRFPELVSHLVIANGVHPGPFQRAMAAGGRQTEASQYISDLRAEGKEHELVRDEHAAIFDIFNKHMDMGWMTPARRDAYRKAWGDVDGVRAMLNWYRASPLKLAKPGEPIPPEDLPDLPKEALRVSMPHLLIWGMNDSALLPESYEGLEAYCDDLTIEEIENADHWILHQRAADVAARIRRFLEARPVVQ
ncbi:pimeloyl-ACP methyl ester carboxylesterase [Shimia isoporae]|uniref:Pimeloyl-ACP methyl ester carboxylesterase n=1 Tax=Shimia isoporae TaxID=647720 RepID=A0A4R1N031_9RHOB|nr:alpha/beta hydrolase [Shimia isoporae]TCK98987.1 pimeloyl-ACP methyl ester carboxylesterase [Shimia isoporae]